MNENGKRLKFCEQGGTYRTGEKNINLAASCIMTMGTWGKGVDVGDICETITNTCK